MIVRTSPSATRHRLASKKMAFTGFFTIKRTMPSTSAPLHVWKFFRCGGLDQVVLESGADLLALDQLDQELWVALSCPVKGLELDEKTLALVDTDGDGRIGVPDVVAAVKWAAARLNDAGELLKGGDVLPLAAINSGTPEGKTLLASAKQILASIGRRDAAGITIAEATDTARIFAANPLNGDGIIPEAAAEDPAVQALIRDIIACVGGVARRSGLAGVTAGKIDEFFAELAAYVGSSEQKAARPAAVLGEATDAAYAAAIQSLLKEMVACLGGAARSSGSVGVTAEMIDTFFAELSAYVAWIEQSATKEIAVLGEATEEACGAIRAVRAKVEDFFTRSRLAAFDAGAIAALNRNAADYLAIAARQVAQFGHLFHQICLCHAFRPPITA